MTTREEALKYGLSLPNTYKEESEYSMTFVDFDELQEEAEEWAERQREKDEF